MGWRGVLLIAAMAWLGAPPPAHATDAGWAGRRPAILTLTINEVQYGDALVLLTANDALVARNDLQRAGVSIRGAHTATVRDRQYVSLRSLGIRYVANEPDMIIRLTVSADLLGTTRIDLGRGEAPAGLTYPEQRSAYLNYAVHAGGATQLDGRVDPRLEGFVEVGTRLGGALSQGSVTFSAADVPVRGPTTITWDDRNDLRRLIAGDHLVIGGGLGGSAFIGGLHLERGFDLDPYLSTAPALALRGAVAVPSTAEVYVDGALVQRIDLPPGTYNLSNVPASAGAGTTRVVVRDMLGRTQELGSSFYLPSGLLRAGLSDYALSIGARREEVATTSFRYGGPAAVARYRRGLSRRVTAGVHGEASFDLAAGGVVVSTGGGLGQLELGVAGSVDGEGRGVGGSLSWAFLGRRGGAALSVRALSARYATLDLGSDTDGSSLESRLSVNRSLSRRLGVSAQAAGNLGGDGGRTLSAGLTLAITLAPSWMLTTSVSGDDDSRTGRVVRAFASLSMSLGERTRGGLRHEQVGGEASSRADVHRSIGRNGLGYRLAASFGEREAGSGEVELATPKGTYRAAYRHSESGGHAEVAVTGGVTLLGGRLFATRAIERGFLLVRVPEAEGVRVYLDNQEIGRTDDRGDLLVTGALPNYGNRVAIEPADLPDDRPPALTSLLLAPPQLGGVVAEFAAPRMQVLRGRFQVKRGGRLVAPAFGELTVGAPSSFDDPESTEWTSPLGSDGEFEIDGLPPGRYPAVVYWDGGRCDTELDVRAVARSIADLGVVVCQMPAAEARR